MEKSSYSMNAAQCIVRALLESDEDLMAELGEIAADPILGGVKYALERGEEYHKDTDMEVPYSFALEIDIKPIGMSNDWARNNGSRMVSLRWTHHSKAWGQSQGGGYFFVKPPQFSGFLKALSGLVKECSKVTTSDESVKKAYGEVIRYRYSAPRKAHARQKYTENGLYAYMR